MPHFSFFTSHSKEPVTQDSPLWQQPIPLRLDVLLKADDASVSHADYFQAAQAFLKARSYDVITRAASQRLDHKVRPQNIDDIRIYLEKHGAYYHPARIVISIDQKQLSFVLNVALSESGRRFMTVASAAVYSDLSRESIRRMLAAKDLTAHRPRRGRLLIDKRQLDALILSSTSRPRKGRGLATRQRKRAATGADLE